VFRLVVWKVRLGLAGSFRAFGSSMEPVIPSGSRVTVEPVDVDKIELGDIVVAQVGDSTMLHLVKSIDAGRRQVEISGTSGPPNGWTTLDLVYGICTRIGETPVPGFGAKTNRLRLLHPKAASNQALLGVDEAGNVLQAAKDSRSGKEPKAWTSRAPRR
jgi:Peptidase S24-like